MMARVRPGTPATHKIEARITNSSTVVPRLGWARISMAMGPKTTSTGRMVTRLSCIRSARDASRSARNTTSASLASSDGCSVRGPNDNQRLEPFTV